MILCYGRPMSILILGMHRSGTSVTTQLIGRMGAYIAPAGLLLPPDMDNPRGFFERKDALAINRSIMRLQNCNWYHAAGFSSKTEIPFALHTHIQRCADDLQQYPPYVMKDPRLCLTLPYWLAHFSPEPTIVIASRHPAAIAHSLHTRNGMDIEDALALWVLYMQQALENSRGMNIVRTSYEDLIEKPEATTKALYQSLSQYCPKLQMPTKEEIAAIISPALSHAKIGTDIKLTNSQEKLYEQLRAA